MPTTRTNRHRPLPRLLLASADQLLNDGRVAGRRSRSRGWRALTLGAAVATIGLAACGGSESNDGSPTAEAPISGGAALSGDASAAGDGSTSTEPASTEHDNSGGIAASDLSSDGPLDVCALISSDDVSAAFGVEFDHGTLTHHEQIGGDQCVWSGVDPMSIDMFSLAVQRQQDLPDEMVDNGIDVERIFDESWKMADGTDLPLGDKAYTTGTTIEVLVGNTSYSFMTVGDAPDDVAALNTLATALIESVTS